MKISDAQSMVVMAALGLALGAVAYVILRGVKGTARDIASGSVGVVKDVFAGTMEGTADGLGLPVTDLKKCQAAKDSGDTWGVIKNCPGDGSANVWSWWWNK